MINDMSILELVLIHAPDIRIPYEVLCNTACVNKECNILTKRAWLFARPELFVKPDFELQSNGGLCRFCKDKPVYMSDFASCYDCSKQRMSLITATQAKKAYRLDDNDIDRLNSFKKEHRLHRCIMTLVDKNEAIEYAMLKHQGPDNIKKKPSKALLSRRAKLMEVFGKNEQDLVKEGVDRYMACVYDYTRNGKGGMRAVKCALAGWDAFEDLVSSGTYKELSHEAVEAVRRKLMSGSVAVNDAQCHLDCMLSRYHELSNALREVGLNMRSDSEMSRKYVAGDRNALSIHDTVKLAQQMHFLYTKTRYDDILRKGIIHIQREIRETYGLLPYKEMHDMMADERVLLREDAKRQAVREAKIKLGTIPDYMNEFMKNLKI